LDLLPEPFRSIIAVILVLGGDLEREKGELELEHH
jgi:hypothetical protein